MSTHYLAHVTTGLLVPGEGVVETYLAEEANIKLWSPVAVVAAGSGEYIARAGPTSSASDAKVIGIVVGPLRDAENLYACDAAGQAIQVCTKGKCKVRVDGTDAIAVGDALVSYEGDYYAKLMVANPGLTGAGAAQHWDDATVAANEAVLVTLVNAMQAGFAMALYAATVDGDIIACYVYGARGTPT